MAPQSPYSSGTHNFVLGMVNTVHMFVLGVVNMEDGVLWLLKLRTVHNFVGSGTPQGNMAGQWVYFD